MVRDSRAHWEERDRHQRGGDLEGHNRQRDDRGIRAEDVFEQHSREEDDCGVSDCT